MIEIPLLKIIGVGLALGVRITGLMLFAPFLGSAVIPARIKAVLVIVLTAVMYPTASARVAEVQVGQWPMLVITEMTIGVALGIATSLVFEAAQMAGQILSIQMGYSLVNILDPQTQVDTTVVSLFHQTIAMLIFLQMDVHHWLIKAVANSYSYLPPGTGTLSRVFTGEILRIGGSVFEVGLQIAAPVLAATLVADIVIGLLGKASPQMPLLLLGPAIKSILGIGILVVALKYWPDMFSRLFTSSMTHAQELLHLAR